MNLKIAANKTINTFRKTKIGSMKIEIFKVIKKSVLTFIIGLLAAAFIFPLFLTVSNSFMKEMEITRNYGAIAADSADSGYDQNNKFINFKFIPDEVTIGQYYSILIKKTQYLFMFWNSVILVVPIVLGQIVVSSLAAYAFAKLEFRFREGLFFLYIVVMLMPFQVTLVPNYLVFDKLGLLDNYLSIILPGVFSTFGVFLLRQFIMSIPDEYIQAARIDGAGHMSIFFKIILPLCKPGIAALAILVFIDNWNMVEQPLIFLHQICMQPLSISLSAINQGELGIAFAASSIYMIPMLLIFLYGENYLIKGIKLSGLKG